MLVLNLTLKDSSREKVEVGNPGYSPRKRKTSRLNLHNMQVQSKVDP